MKKEIKMMRVGDQFVGKGGGKLIWVVKQVLTEPAGHLRYVARAKGSYDERTFYSDQTEPL